jgi:UDP-2,3-diacylglucosamine hydrolase
MSRTLFVSDVHLRPNDPAANRPFLRFLEQGCDALYVVGDLFDYWIGPRQIRAPDYRPEIEALRRASERTAIWFIKGNRDYLVEGKFEKATGARILGDRGRIALHGKTVLLAHGDFIYNTNPKYAAYRTLMRSKPVEDLWLAVPGGVARQLVRGYRKVSPLTTPAMTWTPAKLLERARPFFEQGADVLICGHIHQPQRLETEVRGRRCELFMMGDWCGGTQDYVEHDGRAFRFLRWPKD